MDAGFVFPSSLVFLIVVEWFLIVIACFSKAKNKANLYQKKITLFKREQVQKTGPQRVPPCRSLHLQLKIGISTCNKKNNLSGSSCIFSLLP